MPNSTTPALGTALRNDDETPHIAAMTQELQHACTNASEVIEQMLVNETTEYCTWSGQQDDGRLPLVVDGREPEPWGGASDVRVRLADELINDRVTVMKTAARRATFALQSFKGASMEAAGKVRSYMNWLRNSRMRRNVNREQKLVARWVERYGAAAMGITWHQEWAREYQTVTVAQLEQAAAQVPGGPAAQILGSLYEPDRDVMRAVTGLLRQMYPDLKQGDAYTQLRALQRTGEMTLPARYLRKNEPRWKALKWWSDLFGPLNVGDVQAAPWLAHRVVLTPAQVREKKISEGWGEAFCDAVVAKAGSSCLDWVTQTMMASDDGRRRVFTSQMELMEGLCEVFYFYHTHADEDGVPCIYLTVMSPHAAVDAAGEPLYGLDQPYDYEHGEYPIVSFQREFVEDQVHESRGVPELVQTQQSEAKAMRDARVNQTELLLQPPLIKPEREVGLKFAIRPRGEIGERRNGAIRPWAVGNTAPAGEPLEHDARQDAYRYWGRNRAEEPVRAGMYEQDLADDFLEEIGECWAMTLKLAQQFEDEVRFDRVVGGNKVNIRMTREDLQGEYDFILRFNVDALDPERLEKKVNAMAPVFQSLDRAAVIDWGPMVRGLFANAFPEFADESLRSDQQATEAEVKDEQNNWSLMMAGTEPPMHEEGQNFQARLAWLEQQMQQPGSVKRLAQNPDSAELVQKRHEHLAFQVQQQVNAQTGRVGVQAGPTAT